MGSLVFTANINTHSTMNGYEPKPSHARYQWDFTKMLMDVNTASVQELEERIAENDLGILELKRSVQGYLCRHASLTKSVQEPSCLKSDCENDCTPEAMKVRTARNAADALKKVGEMNAALHVLESDNEEMRMRIAGKGLGGMRVAAAAVADSKKDNI